MKENNIITLNNAEVVHLFSSTAKPRKNSVRIHHHIMIELSLIVSGNGTYRTSDGVTPISAGDIYFYRPNEAHCITDIDEGSMEILNLHVAPSFLYTACQNALNSEYIKIISANFPINGNKLNDFLPPSSLSEIRDLVLRIKNEFDTKKGDYVTMIVNYISSILITISRAHSNLYVSDGDKQNYQKITAAINYIDSHFKSTISLEEIASQVGYSRCHFSHIFSKCMGMSVWDYICIKRIEEALNLIKTTDQTILQIATECGFNNTINFNKTFKKYTSLSPSAFRK